jgi:hypothetical protein
MGLSVAVIPSPGGLTRFEALLVVIASVLTSRNNGIYVYLLIPQVS